MDGRSRHKGRFMKKSEIERRKSASMNMKNLRSKDAGEECPDRRSSDTTSSPSNTTVSDGEIPDWRQGRRIVELGLIADQLRSCVDCGGRIFLDNIVSEKRQGLGSILYIECSCGMLNSVVTNKRHSTGKRGVPTFDVNTKAALGKILIQSTMI